MTDAVSYDEAYADWRRDPQAWWAEAAEGITWTKRWDRVFDPSLGAYGQWFAGGMLNTCYNCVDRHVEAGRGSQPALIWDSAMTGTVVVHTYAQLRDRTAKLAGALQIAAAKFAGSCQHVALSRALRDTLTQAEETGVWFERSKTHAAVAHADCGLEFYDRRKNGRAGHPATRHPAKTLGLPAAGCPRVARSRSDLLVNVSICFTC